LIKEKITGQNLQTVGTRGDAAKCLAKRSQGKDMELFFNYSVWEKIM